MSQSKVVVVGFHGVDGSDVDKDVVMAVANHLLDIERGDLIDDLLHATMDPYDMTRFPQRGDAMDAILPGVQVVVALNIFGVSKIPGGIMPESKDYLYCRDNGYMLDRCMKVGAMFFCFGAEQPWFSEVSFDVKELAFEGSGLKLYERK